MQPLAQVLLRASRRMRDVRCVECVVRNLGLGALLLAGLVLVDKSGLIAGVLRTEWKATGVWHHGGLALPGLELPAPYPVLLACALLLALLLAALEALRGRFTPARAAMALDERARLKERVTTAAVLGASRLPMSAALVADATAHVRGLQLTQIFPFTPGRHGRWLPWALLALGAALFLVPDMDLLGTRARRRQRTIARQRQRAQVKRMAHVVREQARKIATDLKRRPRPNRKLDELARKLKELARKLEEDPKMDPELAQKMLNRLQDKLREEDKRSFLADKLMALRTPRARRSLLREAIKKLKRNDLASAATAMRRLRRKLQRQELSKEELQRLSKELRDLAGQLGELGLESLSKAMRQADEGLKDLDDLSTGDREQMRRLMDLALRSLKGETPDLSKLTGEERALLRKLQRALAKMRLSEDALEAMRRAAAQGRVRMLTLQELKQMLRQMKNGRQSQGPACKGTGECPSCKGTGKCKVCGGGGSVIGPDGKRRPCPNCKGSGKCPDCRGSGKRQACGGGTGGGVGFIPGTGMGAAGSGRGGQAGGNPGAGMVAGTPHRVNKTSGYNSRIRARKLAQGRLDMMFIRGLPPGDNRIKTKYAQILREVQEAPESVREREFIPREQRELVRDYQNIIKGVK